MTEKEINDFFDVLDLEALEEKARKLAAFNNSAVTAGNATVVFAMLILQEILEQQARQPINNLINIITIANTLATLNSSIKVLP